MTKAKWRAGRVFNETKGRWYRQWWEPKSREVRLQAESRWMWERANGPISEGCVVHHMDGDWTNNDLGNLQLLSDGDHRALHARLRGIYKAIGGIEHKRCSECGGYKLLGDFHAAGGGKRQGKCKVCKQEYDQGYHAKHRERIGVRSRERWARNKDRYNAQRRERYAMRRHGNGGSSGPGI